MSRDGDREVERRGNVNTQQRSDRLKAAGLSTPLGIALAIIVAELVKTVWGVTLSSMMFIAISAVAGSITTTIAICFADIRAIVLARLLRRRAADRC